MTPEHLFVLLSLGSGTVGALVVNALVEYWRERRTRRAQKEDEEAERRRKAAEAEAERNRHEEAALRAIEAFVTQKGFESIARLEESLNDTREDAQKAHLRANEAEKRADEEARARREMQVEIGLMKRKQTDCDKELATMKADHADTLVRLERSEKARLEAEAALVRKTGENAALVQQLSAMQQQITTQGEELVLERTKREVLESKVGTLEETVLTITSERDQLRQKSDRLETENRELRAEQGRQAVEIEEQGRRIQELQSQLDTAKAKKAKPDG